MPPLESAARGGPPPPPLPRYATDFQVLDDKTVYIL